MALHFTREEFAARQAEACRRIAAAGLDGLLIFRQESMYYLTGYDTSGYSMFQAMYLGADGGLALLTRTADQRQSRITSVIKDIHIWYDRAGATPGDQVRDMLESYGCRGKRVGVEYHAYGLTAQRGKMVDAALEGFCILSDASDIIRVQRLVKSPAELAYFRRAGQLTDQAWDVAVKRTKAGVNTGAIYGEMINTVMAGDGDPSASRWPMGAGQEALMVRYHTGHGPVGAYDQVQFEFAASYRHYHAAAMNVILTGKPDPRHLDMFKACAEALDACQDKLRAGVTVGEIFAVHARVLKRAGYEGHYMAACGYTMGATYPPTWMDWPMIYADNPDVLQADMLFFLHMILLNSDTGLAMSLGETAIVTNGACERITHMARQPVING
ncbi:MAG: aminopeptidase P family protein [Alphaproteobacteria bacterium]|nr:aminopeptidase P family protein [Alphaproteobacteria bacterium]